MNPGRTRYFTLAGTPLLGALLLLAGGFLAAQKADNPAVQPVEPVLAEQPAQPVQPVESGRLGGPDRYLTHVSTDKPMYRPGESAYIRAVLLHASLHTPIKQQGLHALIKILGPKGELVTSGRAPLEASVGGFRWDIPEGQAGGEYTVRVEHPKSGFTAGERKFDVRAYRAPRMKTQIEFLRDGYGPGDTVQALVEVKRAEGGIPEGAAVTIIARVDGEEVHREISTVDGFGVCYVKFTLPERIERGEGSLGFVIDDGGAVETATKTIPILLQTVDLEIFPEGGDLIAGLENRVYIESRTPARKPADVAGLIRDSHGAVVGRFRTEHEGRGRFRFTPRRGERYLLEITEPAGIDTRFRLPEVKERGVVLSAAENRFRKGRNVALNLLSTETGTYRVTLSKKETELASTLFDVVAGQPATVMLTPPSHASGVIQATVWDLDGRPLAERLIYREPTHSVKVELIPDRDGYVPGEKVRLTVRTTDERGRPVSAVVGVTITDDSVLEMIEKREQSPRLPVMVLLENDVQELTDAHVYLDPENREAPLALDLLLGTQGWRRFAFFAVDEFLNEHGELARRAVALREAIAQQVWALGKNRAARFRDDGLMVLNLEAVPADALKAGELVLGLPEAPHREENRKGDHDPAVDGRRPFNQRLEKIRILREADAEAEEVMARIQDLQQAPMFITAREYSHTRRPDRKPDDRVDFTETLFWHSGVKTDTTTGQAELTFDLSDSVTSFRALGDAFDSRGGLGSGTCLIESVEPFYVEPKLPLEVTQGDVILLPVGIVNSTDSRFEGARLVPYLVKGIEHRPVDPFTLDGNTRVREIIELRVGSLNGDHEVVLEAIAGPYKDRVTRMLRIVPRGFPVELAQGGMLEPNRGLEFSIVIPSSRVPNSLVSKIAVYPTPLANLSEALERLIREPCGCFEQTSSSNYPLTMAQQYFMTHRGIDPELISRSRKLLDRGYQRLLGFECKSGGFEWFGQDPGHEALTAYGLLEFADMAKVREVDPAMLKRTRDWLLGRRVGKGGFKRERRALHTWISDPDCSNGYIIWALLESGEKPENLSVEIAAFGDAATGSKNSYVIALGANIAALSGDMDTARALMDQLVKRQGSDGAVSGGTTSIVGSGGQALEIEGTSLAVLAWLRDPGYTSSIEKAIRFLADSCQAGRFGSTQSTILALRAIVAHDAANAHPKVPGAVQLLVDGIAIGEPVRFDERNQGAISLRDIAHLLTPGQHTVELRMADGSAMPVSVAITYFNDTPSSQEACKVDIAVSLQDTELVEGAITEANVVVRNRSDEAIPTPIAIVGIPGGLEIRHDQLKELVKSGKIAAYDVRGREVALYWRSLEAAQEVRIPLSLVAEIPGTYKAPANRAYLYYTDELKTWTDGVSVAIAPRA